MTGPKRERGRRVTLALGLDPIDVSRLDHVVAVVDGIDNRSAAARWCIREALDTIFQHAERKFAEDHDAQ